MKLVAFGAGRKDGNTEVYIKEALMAAEEMGIEVEYVRLRDFVMEPCSACSGQFCPAMDDPTHCIHGQDDCAFLLEKFLDSDGYIFGGPVYSTTLSSLSIVFRDRVFGPKVDAVMMQRFGTPKWAEGRVKSRPGAIISVGGALSQHWVAMGIPSAYSTCFSASTSVVDYMNVTGVANPGAAVLNDKYLAQARRLGQNVAKAMLENDHSWKGDAGELDVCPSCHYNCVLINPAKKEVCCATCGTHGHITFENGEMKITWPVEEQNENHLKECGLQAHGDEIGYVLKNMYLPHKDEIPAKLQKYKDYKACEVKSPVREAQKAAKLSELKKNK